MTEAIVILCIMYAILIAASVVFRNNVKIVMLFSVVSAVIGLLIAGFKLDTRIMEGMSGYLDAIFHALTGTAFVAVLHGNGTLDWILSRIVSLKNNFVKALVLAFFIAIPGMISGMATVSMLTAGAVAGAYLIENGMPKKKVVAFVATASIAGMLLPPYSIITMVFLSNAFAGLSLPLLVLGLPVLLVVTVAFMGPVAEATKASAKDVPGSASCIVPLLVALVLYLCYDFGKAFLPFLGLPLIAMIAFVVAILLPAGKRGNPITQVGDLVAKVSPLLAAVVLLGMVQATASRCGVFGTLTAVVYDMNSTVNTVIAFIVVAAVGIFAGWYPAMALASVAFTFGDSNLGIQLAYTALMGLVMLFSVKNNFFDQTFAVLAPEEKAEGSAANFKTALAPALALIIMFFFCYFASSVIAGLRM